MKFRVLVLDMVAKAQVVNQTQFNGKYGCANCFIEGKWSQKCSKWIYPYQAEVDTCLRTSQTRKENLAMKPTIEEPIMGLRGEINTLFTRKLLVTGKFVHSFLYCLI